MKSDSIKSDDGGKPGVVALAKWLREVGVTACTAWRWRKSGMLRTVNIAGRVYLTQTAIQDFTRRAESGEFSKPHPTPRRTPENDTPAERKTRTACARAA